MWNPIETAPRDGSLIYLKGNQFTPKQPFWFERGKWQTVLFAAVGSRRGHWDEALDRITHWRPGTKSAGENTGETLKNTPIVTGA